MNAAVRCWSLLFVIGLLPAAWSQPPDASNELRKAAIGMSRRGVEINVYLAPDAENISQRGGRVLVIGGHDGDPASTEAVEQLMNDLIRSDAATRNKSRISFLPNVYPGGLPKGVADEQATRSYPPEKGYHEDPLRPESRYLWRWVGMYGADLVIDIRSGKEAGYWVPAKVPAIDWLDPILARDWKKLPTVAPDDFVNQLAKVGTEDLGVTPAIVLQIPAVNGEVALKKVPLLLRLAQILDQSSSRRELIRRERRSTQDVALDISKAYGMDLQNWPPASDEANRALLHAPGVVGDWYNGWIDDMRKLDQAGLLKRTPLRLFDGELQPSIKPEDQAAQQALVRFLAPQSDYKSWLAVWPKIADQALEDETGMSDEAFSALPILCMTENLNRETKYFDAAVHYLRRLKTNCIRKDGLYRRSRLDETAWGRGNGFPAMGLAWALSEFPESHAAFDELKTELQNHISALLLHQDAFGCWHQVIDKPGSYREFSSTCMIAWALKRGMDRGWLDKEVCRPALDRAWIAAKHRIGRDGKVVDICTCTGKQKSLRDYYDRPAIWGVDARGGAMALMLATEMMSEK